MKRRWGAYDVNPDLIQSQSDTIEKTHQETRAELKISDERLQNRCEFQKNQGLFNYVVQVYKDYGPTVNKNTVQKIYQQFFEKKSKKTNAHGQNSADVDLAIYWTKLQCYKLYWLWIMGENPWG